MREQVCKPNSVPRNPRDGFGAAIIPLGRSSPPGRLRTGNPNWRPPYLVLHREEFAWPRVLPRAPVRSYFKASELHRMPAPFHPSPAVISCGPLAARLAGWYALCCPCRRPATSETLSLPLTPPCAQPLAGSLPYAVRTFLPRTFLRARRRPPDLLSMRGARIIAKHR